MKDDGRTSKHSGDGGMQRLTSYIRRWVALGPRFDAIRDEYLLSMDPLANAVHYNTVTMSTADKVCQSCYDELQASELEYLASSKQYDVALSIAGEQLILLRSYVSYVCSHDGPGLSR